MGTFEITFQRKVGNAWPAVSVFSRPGEFLPTRSESRLELDPASLLRAFTPKDYGTILGKALFRDDLRDALARAQALARDGGQPLRILLNIEADDLKPLHWERLCAPMDGGWDFLSLNQQTPFSLYLPSLTDRRYPPIGRRDLRALALIAGPEELDGDYGLAPFDVPATLAALREAFGQIPHDFLAAAAGAIGPPSLEALSERLTGGKYSLLHIVCHGRLSAEGETILYLPEVQRKPITASMFIERLSRLRGPQGLPHFAFLMTCESASPQAEAGFGGLGQRLVRELGMPAVLAMTAPVSIRTGSELAGNFYARLGEHGEVDRALSEALAPLMGRPDASVPAVFSRLGGRPLFSDDLDRPLTAAEIAFGLELLDKLVKERAPVLDDDLAALRFSLGAPSAEEEALSHASRLEQATALQAVDVLSEEVADLSFHALALGRPIPSYDKRCPFRGLASFRPEDRPYFFGREALVERLLKRLEGHPFLAVLGPSGSGKSSLVLAGLVPALAQRIPGCTLEGAAGQGSVYAYLTPGADPVPRLQAALLAAPECTLVVVDQFEELFTLCRDEDKRAAFIQRILELRGTHRLVLTMRADFWGECAAYTALKDEMQAHQELVAPLDAAGMRRAIEQQAAAVGLRFEADLAEDILDDVQGEPGAMPLLQHALLLLWERRHGRWLRSAEYRSFGGVQQAIAHTADGIYLKLSAGEQQRVRDIFLRLTRLDEDRAPGVERRDTRRRVALDELVPAGSQRGETVELVRRLADARLVVTGVNPVTGQEEVEVAHEALIRHWKRLQGWLEEDRLALRRGEQVRAAAQQWQESQGEESLLVHRGGRLEEALELAASGDYVFNQLEIDYLEACRALGERERRAQERRRNQLLVAALIATVIFAMLAGFGFFQSNRANRQAATATYALGLSERRGTEVAKSGTREAEQAGTAVAERQRAETQQAIAEENAEIAQAERAVAERQLRLAQVDKLVSLGQEALDGFSQRALLLAIEAVDVTGRAQEPPTAAADQLLRDALAQVGGQPLLGKWRSVELSADGRHLLTLGTTEVRLWDPAGPGPAQVLWSLPKPGQEVFSPDGRWLAGYDYGEKVIRLWNLASDPAEPATPPVELFATPLPGELDYRVNSLTFSPDGRWLAAHLSSFEVDDVLRLWDMRNVSLESASTFTMTLTNEASTRSYRDSSPESSFAFSPDGRWLMSCASSFRQCSDLRLWSLQGASPAADPHPIPGEVDLVRASVQTFSPDGRWLLTSGTEESDPTPRLWDLGQADPSSRSIELSGLTGGLAAAIFSPDGNWLATTHQDGTLRLWLLGSPGPRAKPVVLADDQDGSRAPPFFSPDGRWLASGNAAGSVQLWKLADPDQVDPPWELTNRDARFTAYTFSPDNRQLAVSFSTQVFLYDLTSADLSTEYTNLLAPSEIGRDYLAFSPDGRWLSIYLSLDTAVLWDLRAKEPNNTRKTIQGHESGIARLVFSAQGNWVVSHGPDSMPRAWELPGPAEPGLSTLLPGRVYDLIDVSASQDSRWLAAKDGNGSILLWDLGDPGASITPGQEWLPPQDPKILEGAPMNQELNGHTGVYPLISPDGRWLVNGGTDGTTLDLWDLRADEPFEAPLHLPGDDAVTALAYSPDGRWLAAGDYIGMVRLWDLHAPDPAAAPRILDNSVLQISMAFNPESTMLAVGGHDGSFRLWDLGSADPGATPIAFQVETGYLDSLAFDPNGRWLAAVDEQSTVLVWDLGPESASVGDLAWPPQVSIPLDNVHAVTFSPDGRWLAATGGDRVVLWDMSRADPFSESLALYGHKGQVNSLAFSPDGRWLATSSSDDTALLWDLSGLADDFSATFSIERVYLRGHQGPVTGLAFAPDGHWLYTTGGDGTARRWLVDVTGYLDWACGAVGRNFTVGEWAQFFPGQEYRETCAQWPDGG